MATRLVGRHRSVTDRALDGNLLWFKDENRDGTGNVSNGKIIGHGGWNTFASVYAGKEGVIYAITEAGA